MPTKREKRKQKEAFVDQIRRALREALKAKDADAHAYYAERIGGSACASFDVFRNSWAGQLWLARRRGAPPDDSAQLIERMRHMGL